MGDAGHTNSQMITNTSGMNLDVNQKMGIIRLRIWTFRECFRGFFQSEVKVGRSFVGRCVEK